MGMKVSFLAPPAESKPKQIKEKQKKEGNHRNSPPGLTKSTYGFIEKYIEINI